jgi:hypothetical protein
MKAFVFAAIAGAIFALGLAVGGMTSPAKVIAFLDVGGAWDAQLGFVMLGAIAVYAPLLRIIQRRPAPLAATRFHWPTVRAIDLRLVGGAALFGIGWGLSGYCPGPALSSLLGGGTSALVFVAAMIGGIAVARALTQSHAS